MNQGIFEPQIHGAMINISYVVLRIMTLMFEQYNFEHNSLCLAMVLIAIKNFKSKICQYGISQRLAILKHDKLIETGKDKENNKSTINYYSTIKAPQNKGNIV